MKNKYIPRASKPSANMKKALLKVLAQHQNTTAKFTINLCTNAFVESLPLNVRMYFRFTKCITVKNLLNRKSSLPLTLCNPPYDAAMQSTSEGLPTLILLTSFMKDDYDGLCKM